MRAAYIDKPMSIIFTDVEEPMITRPDEVKVQTVFTGICGSEVHAFHNKHPFRIPPLVSGHEVSGKVVEVGSDVKDFKPGDRVLVEPHYGCGECEHCKSGKYNVCTNKKVLGATYWSGSFGEFFVTPEQTLIHLPDNVSFEEGTLAEPIAVGMHAVLQCGVENKDVLIIGAGPIGLGIVASAKKAKARKIIISDICSENLELASQMGATDIINVKDKDLIEEVKALTNGYGPDVTFLGFGNAKIVDDALTVTKSGGIVSEIAMINEAIEINIQKLQLKELVLKGSNMYTRDDFLTIVDALEKKEINVLPMISKIFPVEEVAKAMEIVDKRTEHIIKVMLKF